VPETDVVERNKNMNESDSNQVITHYDGHGVTERIRIFRGVIHDDVPYSYDFYYDDQEVGSLEFKRGDGPGVLSVAVIAVVLDQLQAYQNGSLSNRETALAITKLEEAMHWLKHRADDRARRNVLGTVKP
jgi:hypothetical protein